MYRRFLPGGCQRLEPRLQRGMRQPPEAVEYSATPDIQGGTAVASDSGGILTKARALALLTDLKAALIVPSVQAKLRRLVLDAAGVAGSIDLEEVPGRRELLRPIQADVLPRYGFEGDGAGVDLLWRSLRPFLRESEVVEGLRGILSLMGYPDEPPRSPARTASRQSTLCRSASGRSLFARFRTWWWRRSERRRSSSVGRVSRGDEESPDMAPSESPGSIASSGFPPMMTRLSSRASRSRIRQAFRGTLRGGLRRYTSAMVFSQAQWAGGLPVWPEYWGVSREQLQLLLARLRSQPTWRSENTVYTLVSDYIVPWTSGRGLGYALAENEAAPLEVNIMVSHAWAENAEEFLEAVLRSTRDGDVMFICALSLYQAEDGAGPTIVEQLGDEPFHSPFWRVLDHINRRGTNEGWTWQWGITLGGVPRWLLRSAFSAWTAPMGIWGCVPSVTTCARVSEGDIDSVWNVDFSHNPIIPTEWEWVSMGPVFRIFPALALAFLVSYALMLAATQITCRCRYRGRMVVVPNTETDIYSRLWCVYEIFVATRLRIPVEVAHTLAPAGQCSSEFATCGSPQDMQRIHGEIAEAGLTYAEIDRTVSCTVSRWRAGRVALVYGFPVVAFSWPLVGLRNYTSMRRRVLVVTVEISATFLIVLVQYWLIKRSHGKPSAVELLAAASVCLCAGLPLVLAPGMPILGVGLWMSLVGVIILVIAVCCGCFMRWLDRWCSPNVGVSILAAIFYLITFINGRHSSHAFYDCYPAVVFSFVLVGAMLAPVYVLWSARRRWGLRVRCGRRTTPMNDDGGDSHEVHALS
mmetsp:Transcript_38653/g.111629  ORF Transcript_38653/g.111629 Transcript_38653/m.111629 type:complete len:807 (-) Transcript_38653:53-2473(-)